MSLVPRQCRMQLKQLDPPALGCPPCLSCSPTHPHSVIGGNMAKQSLTDFHLSPSPPGPAYVFVQSEWLIPSLFSSPVFQANLLQTGKLSEWVRYPAVMGYIHWEHASITLFWSSADSMACPAPLIDLDSPTVQKQLDRRVRGELQKGWSGEKKKILFLP